MLPRLLHAQSTVSMHASSLRSWSVMTAPEARRGGGTPPLLRTPSQRTEVSLPLRAGSASAASTAASCDVCEERRRRKGGGVAGDDEVHGAEKILLLLARRC